MSNRDKRSFCLGIALRLMQNRLPLAPSQKEPSGEPIVITYKGVQLPLLLGWDKEKYPYVYTHFCRIGSYHPVAVVASSTPVRHIGFIDGEDVLRGSDTIMVTGNSFYKPNEPLPEPFWEDWETKDGEKYGYFAPSYNFVFRSNHDIYSVDGSVFVEKSDFTFT